MLRKNLIKIVLLSAFGLSIPQLAVAADDDAAPAAEEGGKKKHHGKHKGHHKKRTPEEKDARLKKCYVLLESEPKEGDAEDAKKRKRCQKMVDKDIEHSKKGKHHDDASSSDSTSDSVDHHEEEAPKKADADE